MRIITALVLGLFSSLALAGEGMLGTKGDTTSTYQPTSGSGGSFFQMIFALLIVLGVMRFLLPKLFSAKVLAKFGGKLTTGLNSSIKIEESATFPGGALHLVTVKGRMLLVGSTATTINTLADLGNEQKNDPGPTFLEFLDVADRREDLSFGTPSEVPTTAASNTAVVQAETTSQADGPARAALERLQQLMR
jgi:flagellar biogenesis protein FliO